MSRRQIGVAAGLGIALGGMMLLHPRPIFWVDLACAAAGDPAL